VSDALVTLEDWAAPLLARLAPAGRRKVAAAIAVDLRRSQQQRIAAQREPDGAPFVPRKPRKDLRGKRGRIKRAAMFAKLRTSKWLKARATPDMAEVGFTGRAGRLATVHQYGEVDQVTSDGPRVRYPRRRLLGFGESDRVMIRDRLIDHLSHR
jgi:phage virion morphogenesis protein